MNSLVVARRLARPATSRTRVLLTLSALLAIAGLFHLRVFAVDDRPWSGPVSWRKPFDFGVSFGATLASVVWVTSYLRLAERTRALLLDVFAVDCVVEVAGITLQTWRDVPSHLNRSTPFNSAVAIVLAVGGAVLVVTLGVFAATALRGWIDAPPSMRLALRAGFALLLLGLASGVAMIVVGTAAMKGATSAAGITHAYRITGFLKAFHGVTIHGVLVLPATACLLERRGNLAERTRRRAVAAVVAGYAAAAAGVLVVELVAVT